MNNISWIWKGKLSSLYAVKRKPRRECGTCFKKGKSLEINGKLLRDRIRSGLCSTPELTVRRFR